MRIHPVKSPRPTGRGFLFGVLHCFGRRTYARNSNDGSSLGRLVMWWMFAAIGMLIFHYCPFKLIGTIVLLGMVSWGLTDAIRCANVAPWLGIMNLLLGAAGALAHWHVGLTFFGHHFESILWWAFVVSGVLSVVRRLWNALIWRLLDKASYSRVR